MGIRENLAALMAHRGISQNALAKATGVPQPTIQRIVRGESADPKTPTVQRLARFFGVSVEELRGTKSGLTLRPAPSLNDQAQEVAQAWLALPESVRGRVLDQIFILTLAFRNRPWLAPIVSGRPAGETYAAFEARMLALVEKREAAPRR